MWRQAGSRTRSPRRRSKTDAEGQAAFDFVLPQSLVGRPQDGGDARFTLTATVEDSAGQKQSANVSRIVTEQPIRIEVIPEAGTLVPGLPNTVYFLATYADGRPAAARIAVSGFAQEIATNDMGAASIEFTPQADSVSLGRPRHGRRRAEAAAAR